MVRWAEGGGVVTSDTLTYKHSISAERSSAQWPSCYDVKYSINLVILALDGITWFLQLMKIQNVRKNTHFGPNKIYGKYLAFCSSCLNLWNSSYFYFSCVGIEKNSGCTDSYLLLKYLWLEVRY